ncbi:hypothetical protein [Erythrobacter sp. KY5]|uniref:hypothetical protein n=1 Tax=Erythrobacter sp. KY5 TaxID=2011159 RepID=UPI0013A6B78F|nr:hypothetical protein [Erythrobacter sp. KY5]
MQGLACWKLALGVGLIVAAPVAYAQSQSSAEEKLAHVEEVAAQRTYFCRVKPRTSSTSETSIALDFEFGDSSQIEARMVVTGRVSGAPVSARMRWRGTTATSGEEAVISLTEVYNYEADPLPGDAEWSDPDGDLITLNIVDTQRRGSQAFVLAGTQETELGTNDLRCLPGRKRTG